MKIFCPLCGHPFAAEDVAAFLTGHTMAITPCPRFISQASQNEWPILIDLIIAAAQQSLMDKVEGIAQVWMAGSW